MIPLPPPRVMPTYVRTVRGAKPDAETPAAEYVFLRIYDIFTRSNRRGVRECSQTQSMSWGLRVEKCTRSSSNWRWKTLRTATGDCRTILVREEGGGI